MAPGRPPAQTAPPVLASARGARIPVKVVPRAGGDRIDGVIADVNGAMRLKLAVRAVAHAGEANAAAIALLARALDLPASALSIVSGATQRRKTIAIAAPAAAVSVRLAACLGATSGRGRR